MMEEELAEAACNLGWDDLPREVRASIRDLFVDWLGSAFAGTRSDPVQALLAAGHDLAVQSAAPSGNGATVLPTLATANPLWAALVNGASSHVVEMDDLHNTSIYHPGTCVFPAALAVAEANGRCGSDFLLAALVGYEVSLRIGEALGREHYVFFHTTGTVGTFGAALAAAKLLRLPKAQTLWAMGNAGSQAAGLWEFLADGAMTKQLHPGKAALNGVLAAYAARRGFSGPAHIISGKRGMLRAMMAAGALEMGTFDPEDSGAENRLEAALLEGVEKGEGSEAVFTRFKSPEVSLKYHASCRHTHPAVDALLEVMAKSRIPVEEISLIRAHVYTVAYDRLKDTEVSSPWSAKFSFPYCLARAAQLGSLGIGAFTPESLEDPALAGLMGIVDVQVDPELDRLYPGRWSSWVEVETQDGVVHTGRVEIPKGDPDNPLTARELREKFLELTRSAETLTEQGARELLTRCYEVESLSDMSLLFTGLERGSK